MAVCAQANGHPPEAGDGSTHGGGCGSTVPEIARHAWRAHEDFYPVEPLESVE